MTKRKRKQKTNKWQHNTKDWATRTLLNTGFNFTVCVVYQRACVWNIKTLHKTKYIMLMLWIHTWCH